MKTEAILNPAKYGSGLKGIFRQAMHEMPLITICSPFCIVGLGLIVYHTYRYDKNDGNNRKYKLKYTLYRPDDPRVPHIKN
ncbi:uncharacterized protein LOC113548237 [Rhopalosiphum maidis]|uniref:uncharacterized protein LOC113548237 n=1 Tax=Rhopalosiphum maidis TaxID=43146 RepID=UPI000EFFE824|nr:uncharacterized protein LOC113548237 [Rhopalosiphum maidis]